MFEWAASVDLVPVAVHQAISTEAGLRKGKTAASEGTERKLVSIEKVLTTVGELPRVVADSVMIQLNCGMRPTEAMIVLRLAGMNAEQEILAHKHTSSTEDYAAPKASSAAEVARQIG